MNEVTQINSELQAGSPDTVGGRTGDSTVINPNINGAFPADTPGVNTDHNATHINETIAQAFSVSPGTVLCNEYVVEKQLDTATGEADIYLCRKGEKQYVAKVYRRQMAIKDEVIRKLLSITSDNVAKMYASGEYNGYTVEVIPYYRNGSLSGKKYTYLELKKHIIPSLNEGLHVLHEYGIVHKDLKPSNIMLNDNEVDVSIIDFGISSVRESGNTVIITHTGMTPQYSAPETLKGLFLSESDYYSLGITIFELYCGHLPYQGSTDEEIAQYASIQNIPCPEDMPDDLKNLIHALTYTDITNRKNKSNPNRRWGYDEVRKWCNGEQQTIPGEGIGYAYSSSGITPYKFMGHMYDEKGKLVDALALNWEDGKKQLFRGLLSGFYRTIDPELAGYCLDAEEEARKARDDTDVLFFRTLYKIDPNVTVFYWKGRSYESLETLGTELLYRLWNKDKSIDQYYGSILAKNVMTEYASAIGSDDQYILHTLHGLEQSYQTLGKTSDAKERLYYLMAYILSGKKIMNVDDVQFSSINDLAVYMDKLLQDSYEKFDRFCRMLISERGNLAPVFESWLISLGKQEEIQKWKKGLV